MDCSNVHVSELSSCDIQFFFHHPLGESIFSRGSLAEDRCFEQGIPVGNTQNSVFVLDADWTALLLLVNSIVCAHFKLVSPTHSGFPFSLGEEYKSKGSVNVPNLSWLALMSF